MKTLNAIKFMVLTLASLALGSVYAQDNTMNNTSTTDTTISPSNPTDTTMTTSSTTTTTSTDDSTITSKIQSQITSRHLSGISVTTQDSVVSLTGNVNSNNAAQVLILYAASIKGVKDVDTSNLTVNNNPVPKDLAITAKVKGALARERNGLAKNIKVQSNNGVVTLTGNVPTQSLADQAIQLAKSVNGVDTVQSHIKVKGKPTSSTNY